MLNVLGDSPVIGFKTNEVILFETMNNKQHGSPCYTFT